MNNIATISDHVILPHQADWSQTPQLDRNWRSGIESALSGAEDRLTARSEAWLRFTYQVLPFNHVERARFDVRFKAALRAGKMAVPYWGRGVELRKAVGVGYQTLFLSRSNHGISAGKYVFIQTSVPFEFDTFDVCLVDSVNGSDLTIAAPLENSYPAGTHVWPMLFGKPIQDSFHVMNDARANYTVSIQFDGRQINAIAEDNFESYALGEITSDLNGGTGWDGPWILTAA